MITRKRLSKIKYSIKYPKLISIYNQFSSLTMMDHITYINNLLLSKKVLKIEGCVVECGTWRGGMSAGFAKMLGDDRSYYLFDSFEGLPDATDRDGIDAINYQHETKNNPNFGWNNCSAEIDYAELAMRKSGVTKYNLIKGWFNETVPSFNKSNKIALLHIDGDWYDSVYICLEQLWDSVVLGGVVIIDDYTNWEGCTKAVHDFLSKRDIAIPIQQFNNISFIIKK